jgi:hypothetical protein
MHKRILAVVGTAAVAGALALTAAGTAGAVVEPVTVTASVPSYSNIASGTVINDVFNTQLDPFMTAAKATVALTASGTNPAGTTFNSNGGSGSLAGTATGPGAGIFTVTATATETKSFDNLFPLTDQDFFDATNCNYVLGGVPSFQFAEKNEANTDLSTVSGLSIANDGKVSFTITDPDAVADSETDSVGSQTLSASDFDSKYHADETGVTVSKVCTAMVRVPWSVLAPPVPTPTVTVTPPPAGAGVPTGGVQTGGGLPQHSSPLLPLGFIGLGLIGTGGAMAARRRVRQGS